MARHAAADGAGTDPIVAAALARQDAGAAVPRHASADGGDGDGDGLGWPGDTTTGGGLGWPGSLDEADATARIDSVPAVPGPAEAGSPDEAGPPDDAESATTRGWRRLFGGRAA